MQQMHKNGESIQTFADSEANSIKLQNQKADYIVSGTRMQLLDRHDWIRLRITISLTIAIAKQTFRKPHRISKIETETKSMFLPFGEENLHFAKPYPTTNRIMPRKTSKGEVGNHQFLQEVIGNKRLDPWKERERERSKHSVGGKLCVYD